MSLSVPYVLRAAVETAPDLFVPVDGGLSVADLDRLTRGQEEQLWAEGHRPGGAIRIHTSVGQLAAARIGLVLDDAAAAPAPADGSGYDLYTLETRIWSETPLARTSGTILTHGDYVSGLEQGTPTLGLEPLTRVLQPLFAALRR